MISLKCYCTFSVVEECCETNLSRAFTVHVNVVYNNVCRCNITNSRMKLLFVNDTQILDKE